MRFHRITTSQTWAQSPQWSIHLQRPGNTRTSAEEATLEGKKVLCEFKAPGHLRAVYSTLVGTSSLYQTVCSRFVHHIHVQNTNTTTLLHRWVLVLHYLHICRTRLSVIMHLFIYDKWQGLNVFVPSSVRYKHLRATAADNLLVLTFLG